MAGILYSDEWYRKRKKRNDRPYRTSVGKGRRKGCLGGPLSPFPGKYHLSNCDKDSRWSQGEGKHRASES